MLLDGVGILRRGMTSRQDGISAPRLRLAPWGLWTVSEWHFGINLWEMDSSQYRFQLRRLQASLKFTGSTLQKFNNP